MSKSSLSFGLIGCGRIGSRHAQHIANKAVLKAVCDVKTNLADEIAQKHHTKAYYSIEKMLASEPDIDVIAICSPNGLHTQHTIAALKAGHHVVCEKPLSISVQDAGRMINEAEKANKRLFVVKQNRFNPPVAAVKQAIDDGHFGKIYSIQLSCFWNRNEQYYTESDWKGTLNTDGGTLYTQFSHFIDLIYWMIGDIRKVQAFTNNFAHPNIIQFEDTGAVIVEFYNGAIGTINYTVNSYAKNMEGSLTIFGEKGTVKIGGQYLNELEYQCFENYEIKNLPQGNPPNSYGSYQGSMSNHDKVYDNVIDVLSNNGIIATNAFEGLKTVEIIERIYQATK